MVSLVIRAGDAIGLFPASTSRPGPTNTGILVPEGSLVQHNGAVIGSNQNFEGRKFVGRIRSNANVSNLTFRNCLFDMSSGDAHACDLHSGATNVLFEDCTFRNVDSSAIWHETGDITIRRCNFGYSRNDAIKAAHNALIEDNWFHHLGSSISAHADGVQLRFGSNTHIRRNFFDMEPVNFNPLTGSAIDSGQPFYKNSQGVYAQAELNNGIDGLYIYENWFAGNGAYAVSMIDSAGFPITDAQLYNNRFIRAGFFSAQRNGWVYRIKQGATNSYNYPTNVWDDDDEPLPDLWQVTV